jgi:hypothetical protein
MPCGCFETLITPVTAFVAGSITLMSAPPLLST